MKRVLSVILSLAVSVSPVSSHGQTKDDYIVPEDVTAGARGSEYVSGTAPDVVLMKVNVWGGVNKPGIHFVPVTTDLVTLFSYAGGPTGIADMDDVIVRRKGKKSEETIAVDVDALVKKGHGVNLALQPNDIVFVPESRPLVSNNTLLALTTTGSVISIILGYFAIKNIPK